MNKDLKWLAETVRFIPKGAKFVTRDEMTPDGFVFTSKPFNDGSSFSISELISAREEFIQQDIDRKVNTLAIDLGVRQWRGPEDGLPPVKMRVEYHEKIVDRWNPVFIVAHHCNGEEALFSESIDGGQVFYGTPSDFRPIRTEEDNAVEDMMQIWTNTTGTDGQRMQALYRAGYRKQESK